MESAEITQWIKDNKTDAITWAEYADQLYEKYGVRLNAESIRSRYRKKIKGKKHKEEKHEEYEHYFQNGEVEINKTIFFDGEINKSPDSILKLLGYDIDEWDLIDLRIGEWDTSMKSNAGKPMKSKNKTIKAKLRPKNNGTVGPKRAVKLFNRYVETSENFTAHKFERLTFEDEKDFEKLDNDRLKELPGIELHLGKLGFKGDAGQNYDKKIARERFNVIVQDIIDQQQIEKAGECLFCIGNDFFNSDTPEGTTTKGTPLVNDTRGDLMFDLGIEMTIKLINELANRFNKVHIRLQRGNHDYTTAYALYKCMEQRYRNIDKIDFIDNYLLRQCFVWGECGIFFTHGEANEQRTIDSIPSEFYREWGQTKYRELHMGHKHKEQSQKRNIFLNNDDAGLMTRRTGSPTGTDYWHYSMGFTGATQKYQSFLWDKHRGLKTIQYTNF